MIGHVFVAFSSRAFAHWVQELVYACMQTKDERARLRGPGLIVLDRAERVVVDTEAYVVVDSGRCHLVEGKNVSAGQEVVGQALFCCRPPQLMLGPSAETSELIQV